MEMERILQNGCIVAADMHLEMVVHWDGDRVFKIYKERDNDVWTSVSGAYIRDFVPTLKQAKEMAQGYLDEFYELMNEREVA